jgi:nucleotide-binding universal stress UspA family protein
VSTEGVEMKRIVVGYDGSEHAKRALERATEIAKTRGARLAVASAAPVSLFLRGAASPVDPVEAEEREKALAEARAYLADKGVEVDFVEGHGDPADVIVQEAEEGGADLVVVGTRGLSAGQRWLLGSVSTKVVQHAPCDVLVVR